VAHPDFVRYIAVIAEGFKHMKPVKVVLKGQDIASVNAA
jgi:hypothetical protein